MIPNNFITSATSCQRIGSSEILSEIDRVISASRDHPEAWPPFDHGTRRFLFG